jgi:hypothetical protein
MSEAGNQLWPNARCGVLLNDIAIALFVLDVFLFIIGWPPASPRRIVCGNLRRMAQAQSMTPA